MSEDKAKSKPATELKSTNGQAVTFPVTLELDRLDGERVQITFQCKFKGKRAWSKERREYTDALRAAAQAAVATGDADAEAPEPQPAPAKRGLDDLVGIGGTIAPALVADEQRRIEGSQGRHERAPVPGGIARRRTRTPQRSGQGS